jgi:hypothetical protein
MLITTGVSAFRHSYLTSRKYLYIFMLINISVCYCICVKLAMNLHVSNSNPLPHWSLQPPPLICNLPLQWTTWFPESSICLLHGSYLVYMYTMSEVLTWSPIRNTSAIASCLCVSVCLKTSRLLKTQVMHLSLSPLLYIDNTVCLLERSIW